MTRLLPMRPRDPGESGRVASSLELFFDLVFVVAVSVTAGNLHHALGSGHVLDGLLSYALVFFAIWWAWMNFTWFATAFDTDDWLYRVTTIVQMAGVLVLGAGVGPAFTEQDFRIVVAGYVVMRFAMVSQWLRAGRGSPEHRETARSYAFGIAGMQVLWVAWLWVPDTLALPVMVALVLGELAVPALAERHGTMTPRHPHHITERYSLFTLILLGESLLASSNAVYEALHGGSDLLPLLGIATLALVVTACLWWIYFWPPHHLAIGSLRQSLRYGYTHYFVFAAAGALSAGVEVEIDRLNGVGVLSEVGASFTVTVPIAIFLLGVWWVAIHGRVDTSVDVAIPVAALAVLCDPLIPLPVVWTASVLVGVVVLIVRVGHRTNAPLRHPE